MANYNEELVERLVRKLPYDVLDKIKHLTQDDYDRILTTVGKNRKQDEYDRILSDVAGNKRKQSFDCDVCGKEFSTRSNLTRHMKVHQEKETHTCVDCDFRTSRRDLLTRHMRRQMHGMYKQIDESQPPKTHKQIDESQPPKKRARIDRSVEPVQNNTVSAMRGNAEVVTITPSNNEQRYDLMEFLRENNEKIKSLLEEKSEYNNIKYYLSVHVRMIKYAVDGTYEEVRPHFRSEMKTVLHTRQNFEDGLDESFQKIFRSLEEFLRNGSGYQLEEVLELDVSITKYRPLAGSSYIPLPPTLYNTNSLLNVRNTDTQCFLWSILARLHPTQENPERVENYTPYTRSVDMSGIDSPTPLSQVYKFERQNVNISINIFGFESGEIFPLHITKKRSCEHHVNLLYVQNEDNSHYVLIKNLNRFLHRSKKHHGSHFFCIYCLQSFPENRKLETHMEDCRLMKPQKISLPAPGEVLEFKNVGNIQRHPFIIYADFECFTSKLHTCERGPEAGGTHKYQKMEVFSYAYQRVSTDQRYSKPMVIYRGPDPVQHFLKNMMKEQTEIMDILSRNQPMKVNEYVKMELKEATTCYVCKKAFSKKNGKVIDHDHVTGDIRGIACNNCNLKMKVPTFVPCVLHNLSGFDGNLIMNGIGKFKDQDIKVIPYNKKKYLSFTLGRMRFIDSLHFLDDSLSSLTKNLAKDGEEHFKYLQKCFPDPDVFTKLQSKQFFPYDYVSDDSKLQENTLPPREAFHNKLTDQGISEGDYQHAQQIWRDIGIQTLGEYSDMYLKTDVALLADVFERFRCVCLQDYGLDPAMYVTLSSFSWDAMMRYTRIVLDPITDIDI